MWNILQKTIIRLTKDFQHDNLFWNNLYDAVSTELSQMGVEIPEYLNEKIDGRSLIKLIKLKPDSIDIFRTPDEMSIIDLAFALSATHIAQMGSEIMIKYNLISACNVYELVDINTHNIFEIYGGILREARGMVINLETGELIAAPFCKFANLNEWEETSLENILKKIKSAQVVEYSDKLDGSLIIARAVHGKIRIFSSGNIDENISIQIGFAKQHMNENLIQFLQDYSDYTCMFELIDRRDLHVVPISKPVGLYLIGMRNIHDGSQKYYQEIIEIANKYNLYTTRTFDKTFSEILEMVKTVSHQEQEGFVANIDGYFVKIKCEEFLMFQRVRHNMSHNELIPLFLAGTIDDAFSYLPEADKVYYEGLLGEILDLRQKILDYAEDVWMRAPKASKKESAIWICNNCKPPLQEYAMALMNGKTNIEPLVKRGNMPVKYVDFMKLKQYFLEEKS